LLSEIGKKYIAVNKLPDKNHARTSLISVITVLCQTIFATLKCVDKTTSALMAENRWFSFQ